MGKSSTINTILRDKKVSVSATPGHTKHFQVQDCSLNLSIRIQVIRSINRKAKVWLFLLPFPHRLCMWSQACASVTAQVWSCPLLFQPKLRWSALGSCPLTRWEIMYLQSHLYPFKNTIFILMFYHLKLRIVIVSFEPLISTERVGPEMLLEYWAWASWSSQPIHIEDADLSPVLNRFVTYVKRYLGMCLKAPTASTSSGHGKMRTLTDSPPLRSCWWLMDVRLPDIYSVSIQNQWTIGQNKCTRRHASLYGDELWEWSTGVIF